MERRSDCITPRPREVREGSVLVFMTWRDALSQYFVYLVASGVSPGTVRLRMHHASRFSGLAPMPRMVTTEMLLGVMASPTLVAPESKSSLRASARKLFGWLHDEELIDSNPAAKLPKVRIPRGQPRPAPDQVVLAAIVAADPRTRAMLMLGAYTGLRCCEIAKAHTSDISDVLRVVGKGAKVRRVPLHPVVRESLPAVDGYLFPGKVDGHLSALWVCELISRSLPDGWTAHTLRHRFATAAYAAERDLLAVQELLGHSRPETTARYTAIPNDALARAVLAAGPTVAA